MKKAVLFLLLLSPMALRAQQGSNETPEGTVLTSVTERVVTPTAADLNCAGFIGKPIGSKNQFVGGGLRSPFTTRFANGEAVYLNGKYEAGQKYTVVRELVDPTRYELFRGQWSALKAAGQDYEELAGRRIIDARRDKIAVGTGHMC